MISLMLAVLFGTILLGMPIAYSLIGTSIALLVADGYDSVPLMAILVVQTCRSQMRGSHSFDRFTTPGIYVWRPAQNRETRKSLSSQACQCVAPCPPNRRKSSVKK